MGIQPPGLTYGYKLTGPVNENAAFRPDNMDINQQYRLMGIQPPVWQYGYKLTEPVNGNPASRYDNMDIN